ncbi:MAG: hypothetical protein ACOCQY_05220 [Halorhabdus sp.]
MSIGPLEIDPTRHDGAVARDGTRLPNHVFKDWYESIKLGNPNDFVLAISASGASSMSGTGKTTAAVTYAKHFDDSKDGFDGEEKATLSVSEFAKKLPDIQDRSAILYDEAQGIGEETGLDARRSMKTETLQAINNILANRDKNLTVIIVAQHLPSLDKRLPGLLDGWLLIREGADEPDGPLAKYHHSYLEDYDFGSPKVKTPIVDTVTWDPLPPNDEDYAALEQKKQEAKAQLTEDGEPAELPKIVQAELAWNIKKAKDIPWRKVPDESPRLTYSGGYLRQIADDHNLMGDD